MQLIGNKISRKDGIIQPREKNNCYVGFTSATV